MAIISSHARIITSAERLSLQSGWQIAPAAPDSIIGPDAAALQSLDWREAGTLGTVAAIERAADRWNFNQQQRFDAQDWWYRLNFTALENAATQDVTLGFDGLATIAEVWLNGHPLFNSANMFVAQSVKTTLRAGDNQLLLRFRSLDAQLKTKHPRPRWRAPMVEHQQLRWLRTTLLGRTPGWSPPAAAVGPWRPIWIESAAPIVFEEPRLRTRVQGQLGIVEATGKLVLQQGSRVQSAALIISRATHSYRVYLDIAPNADTCSIDAQLRVDPVQLWWPHTHGEPVLYDAQMEVWLTGAAAPTTLDLGRIGFRTLRVDLADGNFALRVNDERIFCRGACWTPPDVVALDTPAAAAAAAEAVDQMVSAGMNMVRVGGTMVYENDAFLDACDEKGVLLWQDFMFANMDYPDQDPAFRASVTIEARQLLSRLSGRPCIAVLCGNSEAEQQAAMWGVSREHWSQPLFHELLPGLCAELAPDIPYWPSSTHGGAFPHQGNSGTTSYYGVGAYLRPLTDARRADIRFASECLAFANVPEEPLLTQMARTGSVKVHSPLWKSRVPRDLGAGWDFDDVRDHYLREVFDLDPLAVRYAEHDYYLELGRAVSGEVMAAAFREWRRARSGCNGALIWFLRDLWPGAGWGIVDSSGDPKSAYYCLARLLQPRAVFLTDEGGNGLYAHLINETCDDLDATLDIALVPGGAGRVTHYRKSIRIPARQSLEIPVAAMLEGFSDLSYAYRFGPAPYEAVRAALLDSNGIELADDFHFLLGHRRLSRVDLGCSAVATRLDSGDLSVELATERLARFVTLRVAGFRAEDQWFHLAPGTTRRILMRSLGTHTEPAGEVHALNAHMPRKIAFNS